MRVFVCVCLCVCVSVCVLFEPGPSTDLCCPHQSHNARVFQQDNNRQTTRTIRKVVLIRFHYFPFTHEHTCVQACRPQTCGPCLAVMLHPGDRPVARARRQLRQPGLSLPARRDLTQPQPPQRRATSRSRRQGTHECDEVRVNQRASHTHTTHTHAHHHHHHHHHHRFVRSLVSLLNSLNAEEIACQKNLLPLQTKEQEESGRSFQVV